VASAKKKRGAPAEHDNEERWLLTYADMITLLMALFMVLFSISSVNISKYVTLQQSLKAAFSGAILSGGRSILQFGSQSNAAHSPSQTAVPSIEPLTPNVPQPVDQGQAGSDASQLQKEEAASQEQSDFVALQYRLEQYAKAHGFQNQVSTQITKQGLVVTILTDKVLFGSGSATLQSDGEPLLGEIANLLEVDKRHPIMVEGFTDDQPIDTAQFPSNWELSTTRADTVVQYLIDQGIPASRFGAAGYADLDPVASNATSAGRALNRRVEIVFERIDTYPS
jgi:chemotaxis protein MotB